MQDDNNRERHKNGLILANMTAASNFNRAVEAEKEVQKLKLVVAEKDSKIEGLITMSYLI